jgi:hypothetical protein
MEFNEFFTPAMVGFIIEVIVVIGCVVFGVCGLVSMGGLKKKLIKEKGIVGWYRSEVETRDKYAVSRERLIDSLRQEIYEQENNTVALSAVFPERKEGDSDAKFAQRCRMAVITKAYDYVKFVNNSAVLMVVK